MNNINQSLVDDRKSFLHIQFEQTIETYRAQLNLLIQMLTIFVIANATVIGFAITSQIAGIFFIGSIFPIVSYAVIKIMFKLSLPVVYTAIKLEDGIGIANFDGLVTVYIALSNTEDYLNKLKSIAKIDSFSERIKQLKAIPSPSITGRWGSFVKLCLLIVFFGQITAPFFLFYYFGWRLL